MIGLGHFCPDTNKWVYQDFTVNNVSADEESRVLNDMWTYVNKLCNKHIPSAITKFLSLESC